MSQQVFSATRSKASWKPRVTEADLPFFRCPNCGHVYQGITSGADIDYSGDGRSKIVELPYQNMEAPFCAACGTPMEVMPLLDVGDLPEDITFDFQFRGGFNANCVKVKWNIKMGAPYKIEWVALKTFTGTQLKYLTPKKYSPLTFAFADEDAYCYCDSDPCEECMFRCKYGMAAYIYVDGLGLVRMGFDRMRASGAGESDAGFRRAQS